MVPVLPFWMRQRQIKAEEAGENHLRLTTPNLPDHEVGLEQAPDSIWKAALYRLPPSDGDKEFIAETEAFPQPDLAQQAAFELFRRLVIT